MAYPTAVNNMITDSITQANVKVLGDAPAEALSFLYQATAQSLAISAANAASAQQQANILAQAVSARCAKSLVSE